MEKKEILLSFGIPAYNQEKRVCKLVRDILRYKGDDIEVIVSDNNSSDNTIQKLEEIQDERLHIYKNETNIGFNRNIYQTLKRSTGKYLVLFNDKDSIMWRNVPQFVENIRVSEEFAVGFVDKAHPNKMVKDSKQAFLYSLCWLHPTGSIFNCRIFRSIDAENIFQDYSLVHMFLAMKMVRFGPLKLMKLPLWTMFDYTKENKYSQLYANQKKNDRYTIYYWEVTYEEYYNYINELIKEPDMREEIHKIYLEYFMRVCLKMTKICMNNSGYRRRYHINKDNDTNGYYFKMLFSLWKKYVRFGKVNVQKKGSFLRDSAKMFWVMLKTFLLYCILKMNIEVDFSTLCMEKEK